MSRKIRTLSPRPEQTAGRSHYQAPAMAAGPGMFAATAVLKNRFAPLRGGPSQKSIVQQRFFTSVQHFCKLYKIKIPPVSNDPFPLNVLTTFQYLTERFKEMKQEPELFIVQGRGKTGTIATAKPHIRSYDLYYIPVEAVTYMMKYKKYERLNAVLLGTFAYLHQCVQVPHYGESIIGDALRWIEDTISDGESEDEEFDKRVLAAIDKAEYEGELLRGVITDPAQLERWGDSLDQLRPVTEWEMDIKLCSAELYGLYRSFPMRNFADSCHAGLTHPQGDPNEYVAPDEVLSFMYVDKGGLIEDNLYSYVDAMLEGRSSDLTPAAFQFFDRPQPKEYFDFRFETTLFELLSRLINLLNHRP